MSTILAIYTAAPSFPAADQFPGAARYQVGALFVDAVGGEPTQADIDVVLAPSADVRAARAVDAEDRLLFEINFDQENRIRALEGKAATTRAQYRDALITRWKQLNP